MGLILKDKECCCDQKEKSHKMIPPKTVPQIENREDGKDGKGNDFLNRLELRGGKRSKSDAIGRHLKAVFKESDKPANHNDLKEGRFSKF